MTDQVRLVATARLMVDGRRLLTGDAFETTEREAADLCALGFARRARAPVAPGALSTRAVVAGEEAPPKATTRGRYARRDLRAAT